VFFFSISILEFCFPYHNSYEKGEIQRIERKNFSKVIYVINTSLSGYKELSSEHRLVNKYSFSIMIIQT